MTNEEPTDGFGTHTIIRMKGSTKALYEAQQSFGRSVKSDFSWELDTPTHAGTTNATHLQPQMTEPAVLDKDKISPHYCHTPKPSKEGKEVKERAEPADKHSESSTTPQAEPIKEYMKGCIKASSGNFGFISVDDGQEMFVLPGSCPGFKWKILAIGPRVIFLIIMDTRTKRIRAEAVRSEGNSKFETKPLQHKEVWTHSSSDLTTKPIGS